MKEFREFARRGSSEGETKDRREWRVEVGKGRKGPASPDPAGFRADYAVFNSNIQAIAFLT